MRVRWCNSFVKNDENLKLEIKCKNGFLGYEKYYDLRNIQIFKGGRIFEKIIKIKFCIRF